jgi:molecular chaperone GrpE
MSKKKLKEVEKPLSEEVPETEESLAPEETLAEAEPPLEPSSRDQAEGRDKGREEPAEEVDKLTALHQELEEQKAKAAEYLDGWQRARAEFANYRKRIEKEQEDMVRSANGAFIIKILPVMDDFERAFQVLPSGLVGMTWLEGIALIHRKLQILLEQEGVTLIETEGQMFDPTLHQAVTYEESKGHEEGQIIGQVQKGYKMGDKILRPSLVRVAKKIPGNG